MEHRFFHADVTGRMAPGQVISPDAQGLSSFGRSYANAFRGKPPESWSAEERREVRLEHVRQAMFPLRVSRLNCMFAALSVEGAMRYTRRFRPAPGAQVVDTVNVYEVFASRFEIVDMLWLDISGLNDQAMGERYQRYWAGYATADTFGGVWREPLMEALLHLPARVGEIVHSEVPDWGRDAYSPVA
jgi:hypothetical protein